MARNDYRAINFIAATQEDALRPRRNLVDVGKSERCAYVEGEKCR